MSDWPFPDPENTACMTVKQVVEDGQPILYVTRDDDGMFQFLTGGEVTTDDALLVCLGDMLSRDETLRGVADLPPGGSATRTEAGGAWKWSLPGQEDLELGDCIQSGPGAWDEDRYESWLSDAVESLRAKQATLEDVYGLGSYPRFGYDLDAGTLTFSGDERGPLVASIQVVGSVSSLTDTWLWAWENTHFPEAVYKQTEEVRAFGEERGLRELTTAKWKGEEADGWAMTAAAVQLLDAAGAYRAPNPNGALFLVLFDVRA